MKKSIILEEYFDSIIKNIDENTLKRLKYRIQSHKRYIDKYYKTDFFYESKKKLSTTAVGKFLKSEIKNSDSIYKKYINNIPLEELTNNLLDNYMEYLLKKNNVISNKIYNSLKNNVGFILVYQSNVGEKYLKKRKKHGYIKNIKKLSHDIKTKFNVK